MNSFQDKINKAFKQLENLGYFVKQDFWCCQSCAWSDVPEGTEKVVFYHQQDTPNISKGFTWLAWRGDGQEIVDVCSKNNMYVEWDGSDRTRICIHDSKEIADKYNN